MLNNLSVSLQRPLSRRQAMDLRVIDLTPASESQLQRTLDEVKDFATTDMDRGGPERWTYRMLSEPAVAEELRRLASPHTMAGVDAVSLQPCRTWHYRSQDRHKVEQWALPCGTWTYTAVFDGTSADAGPLRQILILTNRHLSGHMNHHTVDHISAALGPYLKDSLAAALRSRPPDSKIPALVTSVLERSLEHLDNTLVSDFLSVFPSGKAEELRSLHPSRVKQLLSDCPSAEKGPSGYLRAARAFGGTTALVTLVDPTKSHLWVANIGDCIAGTSITSPATAAAAR